MTRVSQWLLGLLRLGLGLILLAWVIHLTGGISALESLVRAGWLVPVFMVQTAIGAGIEGRRLGLLGRALDVQVPFLTGYRLVAVGTLFNNAIPGGTGGDLMKVYYLAGNHRSRTVELAALVVVDRVVGLFSLLLVVLALAPLNRAIAGSKVVAGLMVAALVVLALILGVAWAAWSRTLRAGRLYQFLTTRVPFHRILQRGIDALHAFRSHPGSLLAAVALSILGQCLLGGAFALAGSVLMPGAPPLLVALLALLGLVANSVPLTPGGLGVGEAAFAAIFALAGYSGGARLLLGWRVGMLPVAALGALLYVRGRGAVTTMSRPHGSESASRQPGVDHA